MNFLQHLLVTLVATALWGSFAWAVFFRDEDPLS
jgi:hypothetical protein